MTDLISAPGIYEMPKEDYERDPVKGGSLRASVAWKFVAPGSTPAHAYYNWRGVNPDYVEQESKKYLRLGSAAHELLLGKGAGYRVIDAPNYKKPSVREERDRIERLGQTALLRHEEQQCQAMVRAIRKQLRDMVDYGSLEAMPFESGNERVLIWQEPNGLMCRSALDGLSLDGDVLSEFKSDGESGDPSVFMWKARKLGYIFKLAFYCRGLRALKISYSPEVRIFVGETEPPHLLSMFRVDDELLSREEERCRRAIKLAGECLSSGRWPGYSLDGYELGLTEREKMDEIKQPVSEHISSEDVAAGLGPVRQDG